jgi:hypothetical protein
MILTERDRALLGYLGVARYATAPQVHRLIAPGHDKAIVSRRLARLCERGPNPGDDPYLRRIEYRRTDALPFPVWVLTPRGRAVAEETSPGPVAVIESGVSVQFVERVLALNEVLLGLLLGLRRSESAPPRELPFSWRVAGEPIRYETYDRRLGRAQPSVLRPDAIVELPAPGRQRRVFLELETGLLGLEPAATRTAHVERRIDRYVTFFSAFAGQSDRTWYETTFPDRLQAEVIVLVHSEARLARVERVANELARRSEPRFGLRALILERAAGALAASAGAPPTSAPVPTATAAQGSAPGVRTVRIDAELSRRISDGLSLFVSAYNSVRREAVAHAKVCPTRHRPTPVPLAELNAFRELLLHDILGAPRDPPDGRTP